LYGQVSFQGVTKAFGSSEPTTKLVLEDCTFEATRGCLNVLIGPSGCGKSTIVRLIAGYEVPTAGVVTIDGEVVQGPGPDRLVVFQETALFPWMTTLDNVMFGPLVRGTMSRREAEAEALRLLDQVGLGAFRDAYPAQLSGGMQRRAELARALINDPKVMLLDEPFRGLDAMTRQLMQEYYVRLFEESRRTQVFITQDLEEAIFLADRLIILSNSPARVRKVIEVDLPRPRRPEMLTSARYREIKEEALELLHEEAVKAFAAGSKRAYDLVDAYRRRASVGHDGRG
jgi:NitT/TauT family transport system ATP-binding protein